MTRPKVLIAALAALALGVADSASAQSPKERVERPLEFAPSVPSIMVDVDKNGIPIIKKESRPQVTKTPESEERPSKRVERPRTTRRGSSGYVEPTPLPNTARSSGIVAPPPVTPYNPPPIDNPSARINQLNQS